MLYAGLDLHKRYCYITTIDEKGKIIGNNKLPNDRAVLRAFFGALGQRAEVAMEATGNWYWMYEVLEVLPNCNEGELVVTYGQLKTVNMIEQPMPYST